MDLFWSSTNFALALESLFYKYALSIQPTVEKNASALLDVIS
mgnify:CR=1 FL=1